MKILFLILLFNMYLYSSNFITDGTFSGNLKYYFIQTNKKFIDSQYTSANSHAVGSELKYSTKRVNKLQVNTSLMLTHGFLLPDNVEASTLGQDKIKKSEEDNPYATIGELNINYKDSPLEFWLGRKAIRTPMVGDKRVRMLPSSVEGASAVVNLDKSSKLSVFYISRFKQRSAEKFTNIVEHALGSDTNAIIGKNTGNLAILNFMYHKEKIKINLNNLYAHNFLNVTYTDIEFKNKNLTLSGQAVYQTSIGNADKNLASNASVTQGKTISSKAIGLRAKYKYNESSFDLVYRNIVRDSKHYDSILTPWDGTLLYAYSSTTNNLGQSLYGNGLTSGGAYVGGTQGIKLGFTQKYKYLGFESIKTHIAYARYMNELYREPQEDLKIIIAYAQDNFSLQIKGIWINNDTYTSKDTTVNQLDFLTQYHIILDYKF